MHWKNPDGFRVESPSIINGIYKVGPPFRIAKLVQISATTMISGKYNYSS